MNDTENILLSAFVAVESAHAFSAFLPSVFTIQKLAVQQKAEDSLRKGYIPAVVFSLALGGIVSAITKNTLPFIFSVVTIGFMIFAYESAIRGWL